MAFIGRIILPLVLILIIWLIFEIIEFFRLGGVGQPLAWCIVKISVIRSTIIGLSAERNEDNFVDLQMLIGQLKSLALNNK